MNTCDICGKIFRRKDNMLHHKRNVHRQEKELLESISEDFDATESDNQEETDDKYDPWDSLVRKKFERLQKRG